MIVEIGVQSARGGHQNAEEVDTFKWAMTFAVSRRKLDGNDVLRIHFREKEHAILPYGLC